jgi:hypothetical protein
MQSIKRDGYLSIPRLTSLSFPLFEPKGYQTMKSTLMFSTLILATTSAFANCGTQQTLFNCTTSKGKQIEVCDAGSVIQYSFGRLGKKPELALSMKRDEIRSNEVDWKGVALRNVQFTNGEYIYNVNSSEDRAHSVAGVQVYTKKGVIADIKCAGAVTDNFASAHFGG